VFLGWLVLLIAGRLGDGRYCRRDGDECEVIRIIKGDFEMDGAIGSFLEETPRCDCCWRDRQSGGYCLSLSPSLARVFGALSVDNWG
jgi:hypothetical protein